MNARAKDRENEENGNPCPMADRFKCGQAHDGSPKSPDEHPNEWLAKKFDDMHEMYSGAKHKNDWQIRGYRNGESDSSGQLHVCG
jgi:DNA polymerase lambda